MTESEIFEFFHNLGIVPVVKIDDAAKAEKLAEAMIKGGIPCAEVTFRTDAAEEAIRRMTTAFPEMIVGAGTVLNKETAERAVKAGAKFIVSPGLDEGTVRWCQENGIPVTPGVSSTIEIRSPAIRLNNVDFPTFGRPTTATIGFANLSTFFHFILND